MLYPAFGAMIGHPPDCLMFDCGMASRRRYHLTTFKVEILYVDKECRIDDDVEGREG